MDSPGPHSSGSRKVTTDSAPSYTTLHWSSPGDDAFPDPVPATALDPLLVEPLLAPPLPSPPFRFETV